MYQSLYRIWRTRTFSEMVGQDHVVRTLKTQAATGHIAHAYLFSGSRGTGKTSAARTLAMAVNCLDLQQGDPCLKCEACQALINETTLDIFEMDAASNSRVEEIREMLEKVNYPPQFVRRKVYIIDEVHMLSNAAFNALLKTLEEPPDYMVFILATTEPQKIPATILSRCQRFDFGRLSERAILDRMNVALSPEQQAQTEALALIASAAEGSMRDAWSLLDMCLGADGQLSEEGVRQALGTVDRGFLFDFVAALAQGEATRSLQMISQMMSSGKDIQVFLKDLSSHLRRLIAAKLGVDGEGTQESRERYRQQGGQIALDQLVYMLEKSIRAEGDLRWASQQRSVLEVYALTVCQPEGEDDALALRARVGQLEAQLSGLGSLPERSVASAAPVPAPQAAQANPETPPAAEVPADEPAPEPVSEPAAKQAATAPAPAEQATPKDAWNTMLKRAAKELPSVYSMISEGKYGGFKDDCFTLSFPPDKAYYAGFILADGRRQPIEKLLGEAMGRPVRFEAGTLQDPQQQLDKQQKVQQDIAQLSAVFGRQNISVKGEG